MLIKHSQDLAIGSLLDIKFHLSSTIGNSSQILQFLKKQFKGSRSQEPHEASGISYLLVFGILVYLFQLS